MKKKSFLIAAVAIIASVGSYFGYSTNQNNGLSDIQLANIEALASGEQGEKKTCYNDIHSKEGCQVRYCPTCTFVPGTDDFFC